MTTIRPNTAASVLIWIAVVALAVIAWSHVRIAAALEDLADRTMPCEQVVET